MRYTLGPKGVLVLLALCLGLESLVMRTSAALDRHGERRAAQSSMAWQRAAGVKRLSAKLDAEDAAWLSRADAEAAEAEAKRATQAQEDLNRLFVPAVLSSILLHAAFLPAVFFMLAALLPKGTAGPAFAGFAMSLGPIVAMVFIRVFGSVQGGVRTDIFGSALIAVLTTAAAFLLEDAWPFLRRVRATARVVWPLLMTPWVFMLLACYGGPFGWVTMVYLAATAILAPVEFKLEADKAAQAALPGRASLVYLP